MTVPLLVGTDGARKMSQSYGNYVSVKEPADEMFGKIMSIPDDVMGMYYVLTAGATEAEAEDIEARIASGDLHPGEAKRDLSRRVVTRYWGADAAGEAEAAFDRVFRDRKAPADVTEAKLADGDPVWLPGALRDAGLVQSSSDGRRMIGQGAVSIDGSPLDTEEIARSALLGAVIKVGKRRFVRFVE